MDNKTILVKLNNKKEVEFPIPQNFYDFKREILNKFNQITESQLLRGTIIVTLIQTSDDNAIPIEIDGEGDYQEFVRGIGNEIKIIKANISIPDIPDIQDDDSESIKKLEEIYNINEKK